MTKAAYMAQRAIYSRPQGMLWADNYGTLEAYPSSVNAIPVSNFENATTNWTFKDNTGGTISAVLGSGQSPAVTPPVTGTYVAKATNTSTKQNGIYHSATALTVEPGQTYTYSIYVQSGTTAKQFISSIAWFNGVTALTTSDGVASTNVNSVNFTRVSVTATAPAGATNAAVYTYSVGNATSAQYAYFDGALFQEGSDVNDYVNGTASAKYFYVPTGNEVYDSVPGDNFLIISDHNRQSMDFKINRIEKRERMINGRMRSYHVADKLSLSTSWNKLPSRSFATDPAYNPATGITSIQQQNYCTVDGGAGGADLLKWYEDHQGPFWVYLSYDKPQNFTTDRYNHLDQYSEIVQMYISDFSYNVEKRGGSTYDFWNVNVTLEEV